jgi:hypothetical protein
MGSLVGLAVAVVVYVPYSRSSPQGAGGGTTMGLLYGSVAFAFMLFAGLLGARKKVPIWRLGRAQAWMRGHLWLGFVSFPLIVLHSGFHFGVGLTKALMWLFTVVFVSGIVGAVLQHFMPRITTQRIPLETIYEQIGRVRTQLMEEAISLVDEAYAVLHGDVSQASEQQRVASGMQVDEEASSEFKEFFRGEIQPFLAQSGSHGHILADRSRAQAMFRQLRTLLPPNLHSTVDDLENICEEKREIDQQARYHRVLHGWLLVHIPASYALLILGAVHAVMALRY